MENNTFNYQYSSAQSREIEKIRKKYLPKEENKLEKLKRLDNRVRKAGMIESLSLGIIGVLVFGIGMCFFLDVFAGHVLLSASFMVLGTILMAPAYPIYKHISQKTRSKLTPEILSLSEEILKS